MKKLFDAFGAQVNNIIHENPNILTTLQRDFMKLEYWKTLIFDVFFFIMIYL